jgi:hypothetical protein
MPARIPQAASKKFSSLFFVLRRNLDAPSLDVLQSVMKTKNRTHVYLVALFNRANKHGTVPNSYRLVVLRAAMVRAHMEGLRALLTDYPDR